MIEYPGDRGWVPHQNWTITPRARDFIQNAGIEVWANTCVARYLRKDWGDLTMHDYLLNEEGVLRKGPVMGSYTCDAGKLWIVTFQGHKQTAVMVPGDYETSP